MSTAKETVDSILEKLDDPSCFSARAMFGEYALYAHGKVVALVCDNQLYVKIRPESIALASMCDTDSPYPGARPHYVVTEEQWLQLSELPDILRTIAVALPPPKKKRAK